MQIIGIGNLVCDIYYQNNEIIGMNGGKSFANIIFNLANMGFETKIIGTCGNDRYGEVIIKSLIKSKVNTDDIKIINEPTNLFHIKLNNNMTTSLISPITHKKQWHKHLIDIPIVKDKIIIIDSIKYIDLATNNLLMLDIGYPNELNKLSDNELLKTLKSRIEILNLNSRVLKYLIKRLNLSHERDLMNYINVKLLLITKGKKGCTFYYDNKNIDMKLVSISKEVDPNGAGDMFFSSIINDYIINKGIINEDILKTSFKRASLLASEVVKVVGARSFYQDLFR